MNTNQIIEIRKNIDDLDFNEETEVPESLDNLSRLEWLCLEANKIERFSKSVKGQSSLEWLSIENTRLGDKRPITYGMYVSINSTIIKELLASDE